MTDHLVLARKYFAEASRLSPADQRYKGFLATVKLAEGTLDRNEKLSHRMISRVSSSTWAT